MDITVKKIKDILIAIINRRGLQVGITNIDDVLVFEHPQKTAFPIETEWVFQSLGHPTEDDFSLLIENYLVIAGFISDVGVVDFVWVRILKKFIRNNNWEGAKKCMDYIDDLPHPSVDGWLDFAVFAEKRGNMELALKTVEKAYKLTGLAKFVIARIYFLGKNKDIAGMNGICAEVDSIEDFCFEREFNSFLNNAAWELMLVGNFNCSYKLLKRQSFITDADGFHPFINTGHCLMMKGDKISAMRYYRKAIALRKKFIHHFDEDRYDLSNWIKDDDFWDATREEIIEILLQND